MKTSKAEKHGLFSRKENRRNEMSENVTQPVAPSKDIKLPVTTKGGREIERKRKSLAHCHPRMREPVAHPRHHLRHLPFLLLGDCSCPNRDNQLILSLGHRHGPRNGQLEIRVLGMLLEGMCNSSRRETSRFHRRRDREALAWASRHRRSSF